MKRRIGALVAAVVVGAAQAQESSVVVSVNSSPGSIGYYTLYQDITFYVRTSYDFNVRPLDGSYLTFRLGTKTGRADCPQPQRPIRAFTCTYTIMPGDLDADGISVPTTSLRNVKLARGTSTVNLLGRDDKLHNALDDDPKQKVDAAWCAAPANSAGEKPIIEGTDFNRTVQLGSLVPLAEVVRRERRASIMVEDTDESHCMAFIIHKRRTVEVTLTKMTADFDLRVYRLGTGSTRDSIGVSTGTGDELVQKMLDPGDYEACAAPFGNASGDWLMAVHAPIIQTPAE